MGSILRADGKLVFVALGSNLGDRLGNLARARRMLAGCTGIELTGCSQLYESEAVGPAGQPRYLNAVLRLRSALTAHELLGVLREVELRLGRERRGRWGPRVIDCDLLLVARDVIVDEGLRVPHPELTRRPFVLAPLLELAPALRHPATGLPLADYLALAGGRGVRRIEGIW